MSTRSALAGAATTVVLLAALGNPGIVDAARDADEQALANTLTGFVNWDVADQPGDVVGGVVLRLGLALVLATLLCALAGRSRSRAAAFIGGWGALVVAVGAAGAVAYAYQVAVLLDGRTFSATYLDGLVQSVNAGASFGLWTGWLVGLAVALATRTVRDVSAPAPATATWPPSPTRRGIAEPPPPWWAPTSTGEGDGAVVRPGPSVFPPGGMPPAPSPRPPGRPDPHPQTAVSRDPHPSDPDATRPVAMPPADDDATQASTAAAADEPVDPDATTGMPEGADRTMPMPRHRD